MSAVPPRRPWWLGATGRTLERERLEHQARPDGRDRAASAAASRAGARALEQLTSQALAAARSERADRSQRSRRVAQPRRARPGGAAPPRRRRQASADAADVSGDRRTDRRPGAGRPRRRPRLDQGRPFRAARSTSRCKRAHGRLPIALEDPARLGVLTSTSAARSRADSDSTIAGPTTSRAGCSRTPTQFEPADLRCWRIGSDSWLVARRRAARPSRQRSSGRSACSSCRRSKVERRLAAGAGARARHDPADRRARRPARARPAARRRCRSAAATELLERINVHTLARRAARMPGLRRAARAGALAPAADRRSARACRATSATGGAGSPCTAAPTRAPTARPRAELELRVLTFPARGFGQRRLGSAPREEQYAHPSAVDGSRRGGADGGRRGAAAAALAPRPPAS